MAEMKIHLLKLKFSGFWYTNRAEQPSPYIILEHSHYPQKEPDTYLSAVTPHLPPPLKPPATNLLFVSIVGLLWTFHINGIIDYMVFNE